MRKNCLMTVVVLLLLVPTLAAANAVFDSGVTQQEGPGRGDDLARIKSWRAFLDRADRAFFAARMNTEAVQSKITEADEP